MNLAKKLSLASNMAKGKMLFIWYTPFLAANKYNGAHMEGVLSILSRN